MIKELVRMLTPADTGTFSNYLGKQPAPKGCRFVTDPSKPREICGGAPAAVWTGRSGISFPVCEEHDWELRTTPQGWEKV